MPLNPLNPGLVAASHRKRIDLLEDKPTVKAFCLRPSQPSKGLMPAALCWYHQVLLWFFPQGIWGTLQRLYFGMVTVPGGGGGGSDGTGGDGGDGGDGKMIVYTWS